MPSGPQSLDELDDDDPGERERREEEALVQANTYQNEAMTAESNPERLPVRFGTKTADCSYIMIISSFRMVFR